MKQKKQRKLLKETMAKAARAERRAMSLRAEATALGLTSGRLVAKSRGAGTQPDRFAQYLAVKAAGGDTSARELLAKRADERAYRSYLEHVLRTATSGEARSGAAGEIARLDGAKPETEPRRWIA